MVVDDPRPLRVDRIALVRDAGRLRPASWDEALDRAAAVGAVALYQVLFRPEPFVGYAVPALIVPGIDLVLIPEGPEDVFHDVSSFGLYWSMCFHP